MIGITQSQYDTSKQTNRELHLRVELLNFNFNISFKIPSLLYFVVIHITLKIKFILNKVI